MASDTSRMTGRAGALAGYTSGIAVRQYLNKNKSAMPTTSPSTSKRTIISLEVAIQYNDGYDEKIYSFANNINTVDGGAPPGYRSAITRTINAAHNRQSPRTQRLTHGGVRKACGSIS